MSAPSWATARLEKKFAKLRTPGPPTPAVSASGGPQMNVVTQSVVRHALAHAPAAKMLPAAFAAQVIARAFFEVGKPLPIRLSLDGRSLSAEARRLGAWTAEPGPGYIWLAPWLCGVVLEVSGSMMTTVDSDGQTVAKSRRPVTDATMGFLDPGLIIAREAP